MANLDGEDFNIHQFNVNLPQTDAKLSFQGKGTLAGDKTHLKTATFAWQGVQWPLVGNEPLVTSETGKVNATGTPQNYHVDLNTQFAGAQIPPGLLALAGRGNLQQFTLESLRTDILKGAVNATGKVNWEPKIQAQLKLNVAQITIKDFWKEWPDELRINSQLVANLDGEYFQIKQLDVILPQTDAKLSFQSKGTLAGENTQLKTATLAWQGVQWPLVGQNPLVTSETGKVNATGTPQNYRIDLNTQFAGAQIPPGLIALAGRGNLQQFTLESLRTKLLEGTVNATGKVNWQPKLQAHLKLNADQITIKDFWKDWPDELRIKSELIAKLDGNDFKIEQLKVNLPETSAQLSLQGEGSLIGPRFDASLVWQDVQWPLKGSPALINTKIGTFQASGTPEAYAIRLDTDIQGQDIPAGHWQATGSGNTSSFQLESLQSQVLQGALDLSGEVSWQPEVKWKLALKGNNINPGSQWTEWPGKIALDVHSQGKLKNGLLDTQVNVKQIKGQLRDYPLYLKTEVAVQDNVYHIKDLDFKSGKTRLTANGQLGPHSKLDWTINAPDLAALLPEAQGRLSGKGRLTGALNLPHLTAKIEGKSLVFQDINLDSINANVDVNLDTQEDLHLDIVAKEFKQGTTNIKDLSLQGEGSVTNHSLVARMTMPQDSFSFAVTGGFFEPRWQGQLQQLTASTAKFDNWQLQSPAALTLSATEALLGRSCLKSTQKAKVCTQLHLKKTAESTVQATLYNISLALLEGFLPENSELSGIINGRLATTLRPDGAINSDAIIKLSPGAFKTLMLNDELNEFPHQGGQFTLQITENGLATQLKFDLLDKSGLQADFKMPRLTHVPPLGEQMLEGEIKVTLADLGILPTFVSQVDNTQGQVNMDIALGGTLTTPQVQGKIRVQKVATDLPDFGLEIKDFNLSIDSEGYDTFKLQGQVRSGEGELNLKGEAKLTSATDWKADLNIVGKNFEVINIVDAWGLASPDIDISFAPDSLDVRGKITIPELAITPYKAASGAVSVSKDVIIVHPINPEPVEVEKAPKAMALSSQVEIILGDKVTFEGAGFKSRFGGSVIASNQPGKVTVGNGELYIIEGRYKAYGQNLTIDRGRVFFSGGPIDNPGLDIQAYRRIKRQGEDDVIAGIHIQGSAQSPKLILFSQPSLDQSNTLSYIVLGKPVAEATGGEGNLLLSAATALPFKYGDKLAKKMGKDFGLDEAGISTDEGIGQAALVLGKYLSPGLYVSYGIGLFDGSNVLRMRYELSERLTLETETGIQSGVDLRYTLER
ncbi:MAG: hypothetical protein DRQ41_08920 [Gammaproteobacteria bacterium]|nr:MAG: hypothetical protein DRQ41_08920 [Gammaproteobacteria bacterium]